MKQLRLLITICALLISTFLHAEVVSGTCGAKLTWTFNTETGLLKIEGSGEMNNYYIWESGHLAPWYSYCDRILAVELPEGLTNIGRYAFYDCSGLTSITIPKSVGIIGQAAFSGCRSLTSITIPNFVVSIEEFAFGQCFELTSVSIPNSVTSIGRDAFWGCDRLTKPIIVNDMFVFLPSSFDGAYSIPNNITKIIGGAFTGRHLTSISIPNSVTSIGYGAFDGCHYLTSISIPNSVTSIGREAFKECSGLTSISIPNSVTSIGQGAFFDCSGLTSVSIPNSVTTIEDGTFIDCSGLTSISIPNSVTSIGNFAFSGCRGLTSVSIPNSVTNIGVRSFEGCDRLTNPIIVNDMFVRLPKNFKGAYSIPSNITKIIGGAFSYCSGLASVSIPNSVTSIESEAFEGCSGIQSFSITGENPPQCEYGIFKNVDLSKATLYVPADKVSYYQSTEPWKKFGTIKTPTACAKPTIAYKDGQLVFNSATTGAKYHCTITSPDMKSDVLNETGTMNLDARYDIAVYATAEGFTQSETAKATLYWVKADGSLTDNINAAKMRGVVVTADNGFVSVSGLNDGEQVLFYATDGKMLGSQKAVNGTASLSTSESVVICKVGTTSLKVLVK